MSFLSLNIKQLREDKKLSISQLAAEIGFNDSLIDAIENDKGEPNASELLTLANYFNVSMDRLMQEIIQVKIDGSAIKFLVLDVDGTLTDGGMYYSEHSSDEFKKFNAKDGRAIKNLVNHGINIGLISSGFNDGLIKRRAELLGIKYVHVGLGQKIEILEEWCKDLYLTMNQVAYIGDDTNDLEVIKRVGLSACPADSIEKIKQAVTVVLNKNGGDACVREFIDNYILETP